MSAIDWLVLTGTLLAIVAYGIWKTRNVRGVEGYLRGDRSLRWPTIGLSVMATQASAITFLSTPGQAYEDGLGFVQFYFGLPLAMVVLSVTFVPMFMKAGAFTAYEVLERRFDLKTRQLTALLFLLQRGLAAGITIYAPSIIVSRALGWSLDGTIVAIGLLVVLYTVSGGTAAVAQTQKYQMMVMLGGMGVALLFVLRSLPEQVSVNDALHLAGALDRLDALDFSFDPNNRYTVWSGLTGGFFLAMSYFGTDQSQVGRYIASRSLAESRLGLLFNGLFKVPMQLLILGVGVMVFVFHAFERPPVFFNEGELERVSASPQGPALAEVQARHQAAFEARRDAALRYLEARRAGKSELAEASRAQLREADARLLAARKDAKAVIKEHNPRAETKDSDYIFLSFVMRNLPVGLIGLLLAVIFCAAMSSVASELTALGSTLTVDFYRRALRPDRSDAHYLRASKVFTVAFGLLAVVFAHFASLAENLIQFVNLIGSLFYGSILGVFVVAFAFKGVRGTPVFVSTLLGVAVVFGFHLLSDIGFLWFNVIGCAVVVGGALLLNRLWPGAPAVTNR